MVKRRLLVPTLIVLALLAVSGCAPQAAPPAPTQAPAAVPTPAPKAATTAAAQPAATPTPPSAAPTPKPVTLKWGSPAPLSEAPIYVAIDKGYFKEQGITLEQITIVSLSDQIPVLAKGDLDFGTGGWAASVANAVQRGFPVKVIADGGANYPGFSWQGITVRKDLYDQGKIRTIADLKGKKVAVTAVQTMSRYFAPLLPEAKLTLKDIDFIPLAMPDTLAAYANKNIDAAFQMEPLLSQTLANGLAVRLKAVSEYRPGFQASVVVASPQFLENRDVANRWMIAYVKGIRSYLDMVSTGKGVDELIATISKYTPVKDKATYEMMLKEKTMVGFNPNGYPNKDTLAADIEHFLAEGYIKEKVDINSIVDNSLADYAVQKLGKQ